MTTSQALLILNAASVQLTQDKRVHAGTCELAWTIPTKILIALAENTDTPRAIKRLIRSLYDTRMACARAEMIAS